TAGCVDRFHGILSRPVVVGKPSERHKVAAEALKSVLEAAVDAIKPGLTAGEVDRTCRKSVEDKGFGGYFKHRAAYGIGIGFPPNWSEGHIYAIRPDDPLVLQPNMTFHVIPTLFFEDFGMCFSDSVRVTETGSEVLTNYPRELFIVEA
ncbi:MAG: aminopeptidase P family protein, partial [bacterium]|nr:aminopeptidase P family protein [bacterium]